MSDSELPDEADVRQTENEDNRPPSLERGLTENPSKMASEVAEALTPDEAGTENTDASEESMPPSLKSGLSENMESMGIAEGSSMTTGNSDTSSDKDGTQSSIEQSTNEQKDETTEVQSKQSKAKVNDIDISESDEEEEEQPGVCQAPETCPTTENNSAKDTQRTPTRRSRSEEEKGASDELQRETIAKKPKTGDGSDQPSQRTLRPRRPDLSRMHTLEDFGYKFNEKGEMRQITSGSPFVFEVVPNDRHFNQRHYEALGEIITEHVFGLLEKECDLQKVYVPVDAAENDPRTFIFVSKNVPRMIAEQTPDKKLLVLIHGSGVVRAGQWARRLIINNNLDMGTMMPYIKRAKQEGYEIMVLNTNYNSDKGQRIPYNSSPDAHGLYVWENFISEWPGKVAIVAHSAGGYVTVEMAKQCQGFVEKVFAVGFTDSVHSLDYYSPKAVSRWFGQHSKNWVSSNKPLDTKLGAYAGDCPRVSAGSPKHEETSYYAMNSIFEFFQELDRATEPSDEEVLDADEVVEEPKSQDMQRTEKRDSGDASGSKKNMSILGKVCMFVVTVLRLILGAVLHPIATCQQLAWIFIVRPVFGALSVMEKCLGGVVMFMMYGDEYLWSLARSVVEAVWKYTGAIILRNIDYRNTIIPLLRHVGIAPPNYKVYRE